MQVPGKVLVLTTFGIGLAMASGAWWYNYNQYRRTAELWGVDDARLLVGSDKLEMLELGKPGSTGPQDDNSPTGAPITRAFDLTLKHGLVHLRHALTFDDNFVWDQRQHERLDQTDWAYAFRYTGAGRTLWVLFTRDFARLGKVEWRDPDDPEGVTVLPCPKLGPAIMTYLSQPDVAALDPPPLKGGARGGTPDEGFESK